MGNISGSDELVTKQDLKDFYQAILPYLGGSSGSSGGGTTYTAGDGIDIINDIISTKKSTASDMDEIVDVLPSGGNINVTGYTPLGTIISYYGETAPKFYLACDGSEYNKADYPELANHLLSLTDHSQYEVDGNDTKFKVPDLRGEFLRGTGTNGHTNQGSGSDVGEHQDATDINDSSLMYNRYFTSSLNSNTNADNVLRTNNPEWNVGLTQDASANGTVIHARPTNTSVLWCIAYKDIYTNPMNDYSTDEKVIGTWIDGKPIYQKSLSFTGSGTNALISTISGIDKLLFREGEILENNNVSYNMNNFNCRVIYNRTTGELRWESANGANWLSFTALITLQYTKTTD